MWKKVITWTIGGFREMGFRANSDVLMVLSSNGRGIFDCLTGEKIARNHEDYYNNQWNSTTGIVAGYGPLDGVEILCGGFEYKNVLKQQSADGWNVLINDEYRLDWRKQNKKASVMYIQCENFERIEVGVFHYGIDRGYGFSDTGNSFVMGRFDGIVIWNR